MTAGNPTAETAEPVHDEQMQEVLGLMSSHPKGMRWRARLSFSLALLGSGWITFHLVPLLMYHHATTWVSSLFPVGLFGRLMESSNAIPQQVRELSRDLSKHWTATWSGQEVWIWFSVAFIGGALVSTGLSDRWAAFQAKRLDLKGFTKGESWPFPVALAFGMVGLLFVLPVAAFTLRWIPPRWEILADAALLTLFWSLLGWAGLSNSGRQKRRFSLLLGAGALWAVPLYNGVIGFFSTGLGSLFLGKAGKVPFAALALPPVLEWGLLISGLVSFLFWMFWPKSPRAKKKEEPAAVEEPVDHEAVVNEVLAALRNGHRVLKPLSQIETGKTSPLTTNPAFWPLFMHGLTPTNDQTTFFEKHRTGSLEFARRVQENPAQSDWWNGFNLLLTGYPGSGRSTALIAAVLYSATAAGTTSLVIAPRPDKRRWLCSRINEVLRASGMHTHFDCEEMTGAGVRSFIAGVRRVPSVLVATPQDLEDHIFGLGRIAEDPSDPNSARKSREQNLRLEALVASMHAVFVENLADFDPVPRSHVAFQLEKLRLRLASKGRGMTTVVAAPPVSSESAAVLGARIFGETGFRPDRDTVLLHPAPLEKKCLGVELESAEPAALAEEITEALLRKNLSTVLFRKGIDEESCSEQQKKIAAAAGGGRLVVLGDLDQQFEGGRQFDSVVYQNLTTADASVAVGLRFGGETTVVFHIRPATSSLLVEPEETAMPVVAGRESPPLVAHHLLSFWSGLEAGENVERDWTRRLAPEASVSNSGKPVAQNLLELAATAAAPGTPWHELVSFVRSAPAAFRPVATAVIPDDDLLLGASRAGDATKLTVSARANNDRSSSPTRLRWISGAGQTMGRWPVDNSPVFLLHSEDGTFSAASVKAEGEEIAVSARHYSGKGDDLILPAVDLDWQFPESSTWETIGGGPDFGACWFRARHADRATRVEVLGQLRGLVSEKGLVSSQSAVPFRFLAGCSLIVVGAENSEQFLSSGPGDKSWSTGQPLADRAYMYDATMAVSSFLCSHFSGPANFCWPLVFKDRGRTLVWLLEPAGTGASVSELLFSLLATAGFREKFLPLFNGTPLPDTSKLQPPAPRIGAALKETAKPEQTEPVA
jgi:hypothetical protein